MRYGFVIDGRPKREARERAMKQVVLVGLSDFEGRYPARLSGGMPQRVGLARALATDADILPMDEVFSALDPLIRHDMQLRLRELQARLHRTVVFIAHDVDEAPLPRDRIAILKDGKFEQVGTGAEILARLADTHVAHFVRDVNRARTLTCGGLVDPAAETPANALVRPAGTSPEPAFRALADGALVLAIRHPDGRLLGELTTTRVMRALAPDRIGT